MSPRRTENSASARQIFWEFYIAVFTELSHEQLISWVACRRTYSLFVTPMLYHVHGYLQYNSKIHPVTCYEGTEER